MPRVSDGADRQSLHRARQDQFPDIARLGEQDHRGGIQQQRRKDHGLSTDIVGQSTDGQQADQKTRDIDRKDDGDPERREVHRLLVKAVQRRHRAAAGSDEKCAREAEQRHGSGRQRARWGNFGKGFGADVAGIGGTDLHVGALKLIYSVSDIGRFRLKANYLR